MLDFGVCEICRQISDFGGSFMQRVPILAAGVLLLFLRTEANAQEVDWRWQQCFPDPVWNEVNMCSDPRLARALYEALARESSPPRRVSVRPPPWPPMFETRSRTGHTYCYRQEVYEPNANPVIYSCVWYRLADEQVEPQPRELGRVPTFAVP